MTARTTDFSGLLYYNPVTDGFNPADQVTMYCSNTMNEGDTITVDLVTWNIPDGTVLVHTFPLTNIDPLRFNVSPISPVTNNRASFTLTISADNTTASAAQSFGIEIRKTVTGTVLASKTVTINDTSQSSPGSLYLNGSSDYREVSGTLTDWALSTTWTIEFWSKSNVISTTSGPYTIMSQAVGGGAIDIHYLSGSLTVNNDRVLCAEPTPGVWTHVALVCDGSNLKVYYNGTSVYTGSAYGLGNSTATLIIGKRAQNNFQYFNGQLTGIRITNTAVYSGTFDPLTVALPPAKITGTKLLINPTVGGLVTDASDSAHTISTSGSISEYYPPSVQLTSGTSLSFSGSSQYVQVTGTRTDWNLGGAWTIEWWEKIPSGGDDPTGYRGVMSQDSNQSPYAGIDIFHANNNIQLYNGNAYFAEPTRDIWNHVAVQKDGANITAYINGVSVGVGVNNGVGTLTNSSLDLVIGSRTYDGGANHYGQWFKGQIANIRISNVVRYTAKFTPPTSLTVDNNTKLALDGSANAMLDDVSASNHTITNNGTTITAVGAILRSFGTQGINPMMSTVFPPPVFPVSVIGWTMTGPGITQTTTVTGQSNNQYGQTSIDYTPAFVYAPGTYVFTAP